MFRLIAGYIFVQTTVVVIALIAASRVAFLTLPWPGVVFTLLAAPCLTAWVVAEIVHAARPRALLVGRRRATFRLLIRGMIAAVASTLLASVGLAFAERWLADLVIVTCATVATMTVAVLTLSRRRAGHCVYCGYDLRGATTDGGSVCVECGAVPA